MSSLLELEVFANAIAIIEQERSAALYDESRVTTIYDENNGPMNEHEALLLPNFKYYPHETVENDDSDDIERPAISKMDSGNSTLTVSENENESRFHCKTFSKLEMKHQQTSRPCCAICLADFEQGEIITRLLPCRHSFHKECILVWVTKRKRLCPLCMAVVRVQSKTQRARNNYYTSLQRDKVDFVVCRILLVCSFCWATGLLFLHRFQLLNKN